ncbi:MAG: YbaB/EbfC family nucleoid-associated protein [Spirochaetes bacterium]|nr:YbaB/EbfC family nucleoid-associated protein [Spirochaetota bacterium]MBN2770380.1 YbaB/EbfC family nucleoid-associated protein [Spirochaetota bacterium]
MLKGLGDLGNIMKLQKEMKRMQKEIKKNETEGSSSDGMIKITVNGEFECRKVTVDNILLQSSNASQVEKNIQEAFTKAVTDNKKLTESKMREITGNMDLGALGSMFS